MFWGEKIEFVGTSFLDETATKLWIWCYPLHATDWLGTGSANFGSNLRMAAGNEWTETELIVIRLLPRSRPQAQKGKK